MAIRFIRQPSDTPNVSNTDDARMIRYAYGNQNGYVKNAGNELEPTVNGNQFKINSGVVVLQGWESEIDSNGFVVTVDNVATPQYYSVYYEVNLATQTTSIRVVCGVSGYEVLPDGDDLTAVQNGTARLLLYRFSATSGVISNVVKRVSAIQYTQYVHSGYVTVKISNAPHCRIGYYFLSYDEDPYTTVEALRDAMLKNCATYEYDYTNIFEQKAIAIMCPCIGFERDRVLIGFGLNSAPSADIKNTPLKIRSSSASGNIFLESFIECTSVQDTVIGR